MSKQPLTNTFFRAIKFYENRVIFASTRAVRKLKPRIYFGVQIQPAWFARSRAGPDQPGYIRWSSNAWPA
jgi:hypothetical protein